MIEKLLKDISALCETNPKYVEEIVDTAMKSWKKYLEKIEKQRNSDGLDAVLDAFYAYTFAIQSSKNKIKKLHIPFLIDGVKYAYPKGYKNCKCPLDYEFLDLFTEGLVVNGFSPSDDFIKDTKDFSKTFELLLGEYYKRKSVDNGKNVV